MAYNAENLAKLGALQELAERVRDGYATRADVKTVSDKVTALEETGGEPNVITGVKVNGTAQTVTDRAVDISVPTKVSEITNDSGYQTGEQVTAAINTKLSSTYRAGGSVAFADLPGLTEANHGLVVNVTDKFTTTASFVEGAGKKHPAGTNVAVVQVGEEFCYDVLAGFVDLSDYDTAEQVNAKLGGKVDQEEGKGLSTCDYTTAEKEKLAGMDIASDEEVASMLEAVFGA